ncbi:hypothetical protein B0J13DRAFT_607813 [Dactylonectria estremocensis]|uniref:Uncharacterized protein n=1 Tax=Dactylonectria estremocensis TaxID=1079267 RepID=A0A9P9EQI4_9HYPO|nr:hypothetical protein B0J13DRAFT_607813 [Dactylonectria estremocensis]
MDPSHDPPAAASTAATERPGPCFSGTFLGGGGGRGDDVSLALCVAQRHARAALGQKKKRDNPGQVLVLVPLLVGVGAGAGAGAGAGVGGGLGLVLTTGAVGFRVATGVAWLLAVGFLAAVAFPWPATSLGSLVFVPSSANSGAPVHAQGAAPYGSFSGKDPHARLARYACISSDAYFFRTPSVRIAPEPTHISPTLALGNGCAADVTRCWSKAGRTGIN